MQNKCIQNEYNYYINELELLSIYTAQTSKLDISNMYVCVHVYNYACI